MSNSIKFDGYTTHGQIKIDPFIENGRKTHEGDTTEGYDDSCMINNDVLKTKNVVKDLKKLENQFNTLCDMADEEIQSGNSDNNNKYNLHINDKYAIYQATECKEAFHNLSKNNDN